MTDAEIADLVRQFEECRWPFENWHHPQHLAIALTYARSMPRAEALDRMRDGIRRYNRIGGSGAAVHETITVGWMNLVSDFLAREDPGQPLAELHAKIVANGGSWRMPDHWSEERILSDQARRDWVPPDRRPLPGELVLGDPTLTHFDRLWNYQDPAATEAQFRERLPRTSGPLRAELTTQVARTQGLQRKFDDALATLATLEADLGRPGYELARIRFHLERGRTLNSSKRDDRGRADFSRAFELCGKRFDDYAVDALHMLAIISPPDESLAWNRRAMEMAEASKDPKARGWLGPLYNNTGWALHDKGDIPAALEVFRRSLAWREEQKSPREIRIAKWCVAKMLRLLKQVEEALAMQRALETELVSAGESDGYVFEELGECLLALGRATEAKPNFAKAWELLSKDEWAKANEGPKLERIKALGGL